MSSSKEFGKAARNLVKEFRERAGNLRLEMGKKVIEAALATAGGENDARVMPIWERVGKEGTAAYRIYGTEKGSDRSACVPTGVIIVDDLGTRGIELWRPEAIVRGEEKGRVNLAYIQEGFWGDAVEEKAVLDYVTEAVAAARRSTVKPQAAQGADKRPAPGEK